MKNKNTDIDSTSLTILLMIGCFVSVLILRDYLYKVIFLIATHENPLAVFNQSNGVVLYFIASLLISISIGLIHSRFTQKQGRNKLYVYVTLLFSFILILISCTQFKAITLDTVYIVHNVYINNIERVKIDDVMIVNMDALSYWWKRGRGASDRSKCDLEIGSTLLTKNASYNMDTKTSRNKDEVYMLNNLIPKSAKRYVNYTAKCELEMYRLELENNLGVPVDAN